MPDIADQLDLAPFREYAEQETKKRDLEGQLRDVKKRMEELEPRCLRALDQARMRSVPLAGLGSVSLSRKGWARVVKDDPKRDKPTDAERQRAVDALRAAGLENLVTVGFNTHTVSALFRQWDKEGADPPPELEGAISFEREYTLSFRAARTREDAPPAAA